MDELKEIYEDIEIYKDEDGLPELSFKSKCVARKFVKVTSKLSVIYRDDRTRYSMQFLADIIKKLNEEGKVTRDDLYNLKESDVIEIIEKSRYKKIYNIWKKTKKVKATEKEPKNVYYVKLKAKIRYINPLVNGKRIYDICKISKNMIDKNLEYDMSKYIYIDSIDFNIKF